MTGSVAIDMDVLLVQGNIPDLLNQLVTVETVWFQLGLQLGIPITTLNAIRHDYPETRERFTKMLEKWMKGEPTKRRLIKALRSEAIQENRLANDMKKWTIPSIQENQLADNVEKGTSPSILESQLADGIGESTIPSCLQGMLHYITSKIQTCHCSFKETVCLLFVLVLVLVIICQQTPYAIIVQSTSKQNPATALLTTQSNGDSDDLDACLPYLPTLNPLDLSLLTTKQLIGREKETNTILKWLEFQDSPVQVVSIVGGPGVGKSALAVAVGHKLIQQGIAVCYVDMYSASERIMKQFQISKHLDELASQVTRPTLLILDNCDHYIHTQRKEFQNLSLSPKYRFVKVLITSQVRIQVAFSGHGFEEYHLQKLDKDQAKNLLQQSVKGLTSFAAGYICDLVDSMPLAIVNVAAYLNLKSTCNFQCVIGKLEEAPIDFFTETEMSGKHSVTTSIKLAYDYMSLDPNYQKCGWKLVTVNELTSGGDVCLDELKKHSVVENHVEESTVNYHHGQVCVSHQLHLDLTHCDHTVRVHIVHVYRLPRLIRQYFLRISSTSKQFTSNLSSVAAEFIGAAQERVQHKDYITFRMCAPLLLQSEQIMTYRSITRNFLNMFPIIFERVDYIPLKAVVEVGAKAFYWGPFFWGTHIVKKFVVPSLELLDGVIAEHEMATSRNKEQTHEVMLGVEHVLAAYVYFNHNSLGIRWPNRTQCPNPTEAVSTMLKRKPQVEVLHHMTRQNDLAWSAYRAFYIDLFSCCMAAPQSTPGCERLWEYWLKGIVAQAVATNFMFQPCEGSPAVYVSNTFRGLWYYYNNRYSDAKYHLFQKLLEQENQNECLILRIATIMALYNMSEEVSEKAKIITHLSSKLMDFGLPQYQEIYRRVIIPFYREVLKPEEAERLEEQQNIKSSGNLNILHECEYIYWVHNTSSETYVLPPYMDQKGVIPRSFFSPHDTVLNVHIMTKVIIISSPFVTTLTLEYAICPCVSKKLMFVQRHKYLKVPFFGIIYAVIQTVVSY